MVPASLGFMFLTCLGIDLVRQVRVSAAVI